MIKINISMPTNCMDCPCLNHENGECQITGNRDTYTMERPRNCPLIEIGINEKDKQKTGHWIEERNDYGEITHWHCSSCYDDSGFITTCKWDFCPNCGAEMESEG